MIRIYDTAHQTARENRCRLAHEVFRDRTGRERDRRRARAKARCESTHLRRLAQHATGGHDDREAAVGIGLRAESKRWQALGSPRAPTAF